LIDDSMRIMEVAGRSIGVVRLQGRYYGIRNICPHHGAPVCLGQVRGTILPSQPFQYVYDPGLLKLRCPWHGYEFRLDTGQAITDAIRLRLKVYEVTEEDGIVCIYM
jgi:nitrite reductase (NADH) small subunit